MFCNYCGTANPGEASYCGACGKPIGKPSAEGRPPQNISPQGNAPRPALANASDMPRREPVKITPIAVAPAASRAAPARTKEKGGLRWGGTTAAVIALATLLYPVRNGIGICDATDVAIIQQVSPAVEILAARYPLRVGVLRSMFNDKGLVDSLATEFVSSTMEANQQPGMLACYYFYYFVMFQKDRVRTSIAALIENQLDLK
ncbi:MAG TPA: zinc ribbon domain-containing protein [Aestuariivirgaceae bacterium]|jgi:hypothetical protein